MAAIRRNHNLQLITERAIAKGITPLEYMLEILRSPAPVRCKNEALDLFRDRQFEDVKLRLEAAKLAAPYVHSRAPQQVTIDHTDAPDAKPMDLQALAKMIAFILTKAQQRPSATVDAPASRQLN